MEIKSIYELKIESLLRSLELVNDRIYYVELGEKGHFTDEDERKCYNDMIVTIENVDILNTFVEILSKGKGKERTREELIDLQHKYINLARKEIGNKQIDFSKFAKDDFLT